MFVLGSLRAPGPPSLPKLRNLVIAQLQDKSHFIVTCEATKDINTSWEFKII